MQNETSQNYTLGDELIASTSFILRYINPANYFEAICSLGAREHKPRLSLTFEELLEESRNKRTIAEKEAERQDWHRSPI